MRANEGFATTADMAHQPVTLRENGLPAMPASTVKLGGGYRLPAADAGKVKLGGGYRLPPVTCPDGAKVRLGGGYRLPAAR